MGKLDTRLGSGMGEYGVHPCSVGLAGSSGGRNRPGHRFVCYTVYATHQMGVTPLKSSCLSTLVALDDRSRTAVEDVMVEERKTRRQKRRKGVKETDNMMDSEDTQVRLRLRNRQLVLNDERPGE